MCKIARPGFVGREDELVQVGRLVRRARLVTLVGPGGAGKTRLAVELAARTRGAAMIVLDSCEIGVEWCAELADAVLSTCSEVRVVVTSREALRLPNEVVFAVGGLPRKQARQLFGDRASAKVPMHLTDEICARLDRLPLAIELAARLVGAIPVDDLVARLDDRFDLLTLGDRTLPARHRSLRACVEWSYASLSTDEQRVFRALSVLPENFDLQAAEAVCGPGTVGVLTRLVAKSLVLGTDNGFRQLESFQRFASLLLTDDERAAVEDRFVTWLLGFAREFTDSAFTPAGYLERLARFTDHFRVGARRHLTLAVLHGICLWARGEMAEARRSLADAPEGSRAEQSMALAQRAWLACADGDVEEARQLGELAVAVARECESRLDLVRALNIVASLRLAGGEFDSARDTYTEVLTLLDDPLDIATGQHNIAWAMMQGGDPDGAAELVRDALTVHRRYAEPPRLSAILHTAGTLALWRDDLPEAHDRFTEALHVAPENIYELPYLVEGLAVTATYWGEPVRGLRLFAAAQDLRTTARSELDPTWGTLVKDTERSARMQLPLRDAMVAVAEGRKLTRDELIGYARDGAWPCAASSRGESPLNEREQQVADLVGSGHTNRQIAQLMGIAERTVEAHLMRIREKLNLKSRAQVALWTVGVEALTT